MLQMAKLNDKNRKTSKNKVGYILFENNRKKLVLI